MTVEPYQKPGVPALAGLSVEQCESAAWAIGLGEAPGQPRRRWQGAGALNASPAAALVLELPLTLYGLPGVRSAQENAPAISSPPTAAGRPATSPTASNTRISAGEVRPRNLCLSCACGRSRRRCAPQSTSSGAVRRVRRKLPSSYLPKSFTIWLNLTTDSEDREV